MVVLILVSGSVLASLIFAYLFLWTSSPEVWPAANAIPALIYPALSAALLIASSGLIAYAGWILRHSAQHEHDRLRWAIAAAIVLLAAAVVLELHAQSQAGVAPTESAYGASVYMLLSVQAFFAAIMTLMGGYTIARSIAGMLHSERRVTYENTMLFWHYTVAQGLIMLALIHGFPRMNG